MVHKQTPTGWSTIPFRRGESVESRRSGPFLLLCIYAAHPGERFTNSELRTLLREVLPGRPSLNVTDFFSQLKNKRPSVPVVREGDTTYLPQSAKVCILAYQGEDAMEPSSSSTESIDLYTRPDCPIGLWPAPSTWSRPADFGHRPYPNLIPIPIRTLMPSY